MNDDDKERRRLAKQFNERLKSAVSAVNGVALALVATAAFSVLNLPDGALRPREIPVRAIFIAVALFCYYISFRLLELYRSED